MLATGRPGALSFVEAALNANGLDDPDDDPINDDPNDDPNKESRLNPEHAKAILDNYCFDAGLEAATTGKVLAAMPAGHDDYTPHERSMKAIDLAWHIASSDVWFLDGIAKGAFHWVDSPRPESLQTGADIAAWYHTEFKAKLAQVSALPAQQAAAVIDFMGAFKAPAFALLGMCIKHSVHHRGQLSTYLRPMGGRVPGIYGGSADEPFKG